VTSTPYVFNPVI